MPNANENYICTLVYFGKESLGLHLHVVILLQNCKWQKQLDLQNRFRNSIYIKVFVGVAYQGKDILFRFVIECI
jgi:hypothetical protein